MEKLLSTIIVQEACEGFKAYEETFDLMIPTAGAEIKSLSFEIHNNFFEDEDYNAIAPLALKVATYDVICDPKDREAFVLAIAKGFEGLNGVKLFSIEMTSTMKTLWNANLLPVSLDNKHQPKLVITWSEDMRLLNSTSKLT